MFSPLLHFHLYRRILPVLAASPTVADTDFPYLYACLVYMKYYFL